MINVVVGKLEFIFYGMIMVVIKFCVQQIWFRGVEVVREIFVVKKIKVMNMMIGGCMF